MHPDEIKYSWWSYRAGARQKNVGWRIDYFLVSQALTASVKDAAILNEISGSDHCPVRLDLAL
jgi:exodeoxyribonuclease-3